MIHTHTHTRRLALAAALLALPVLASAQEASPPLGGPLVPGVCMLSRDAVFTNAKVGQSANTQLQKLAQDGQASIEAERSRLAPEMERLGLRADIDPAKLSDAQKAGLQKLQALQQKAATLGQSIEAARGRAIADISRQAQPLIAQAYTRHACGLLLERGTVLGGNLGNDLTAEVVTALDAKVTTVQVSLGAPGK
ncbi:OmpH family outer membrane protein [Isoptericola jiangsuensis]|uniref:OmpH family outer membrane protein n=1 Tax=Isoptericola jiangsuensis TaxID=548579 RepID=UPI0038692516